jgi:hypothetical protein
MQKLLITLVLSSALTCALGQKERKISSFLTTQFNQTLYDASKPNNPWGLGLGLQTFYNNKTKFKPFIELTGNAYLAGDKVLRTDKYGNVINEVNGMVNLFAGVSCNASKNIYLSLATGPAFMTGQTSLGIKPAAGIYFPKSKRWKAEVSYLNIFNRHKPTGQDLGTLSLGIGIRLF